MQYKVWLQEWLEYYLKTTVKQKTYIRYSEIVADHVLATLGDLELGEITPHILQHFIIELLKSGNIKTGEGLSANSVNGIITVVQISLKCACGVGVITDNVAEKIKRPKIREKQVLCFSAMEQRKIEQAVLYKNKPKMLGIVLCLYTGLRIGELLALTWSDLDFEKGILSVTKTCYDGKDAFGRFARVIDMPKTETSKRLIPIPKQILAMLHDLKRENRCEYVIASGDTPVSVRAYQRSFEALLRRLNIPHKGFHALRHTFATRAIERGMDVKTLSEILGHKNSTVTLNRYVHSLIEHKKDMMNQLGELLFVVK